MGRTDTPYPHRIAALSQRLEQRSGRNLWRSLEEAADSDEFRRFVEAEFPAAASLQNSATRRTFLRVMASSLVLAGLPGCDVNEAEDIIPWVEQPENLVPGRPRFYATGVPFMGTVQPVVAECHAGRPIRLDGNARHPASSGALDPFTQAAILQLYDPDRSYQPVREGEITSDWTTAHAAVVGRLTDLENSGGEGLRLLTGAVSSPTLLRQIAALRSRFPGMRHHVFEPADDPRRETAIRLAYGRRRDVRLRLDRADVVVAFDADPLGPGPAQLWHAGHWSQRRQAGQRSGRLNRLFVAEATPSLTGAKAARRLRAAATRIPSLLVALAGRMGVEDSAPVSLSDAESAWLDAAAAALAAGGSRGLILVGAHQPAWVQAAAFALTGRAGGGAALEVGEPVLADSDSFANLLDDLDADQVDTLVTIEANPAFAAPGRDAADLLRRAKHHVHLGTYRDETALISDWHLPLAHPLESWSDGRAVDGTASIIQPLIRPLFGGRPLHELVSLLIGDVETAARAAVRETWRGALTGEDAWRAALEDGFVADSASAPSPTDARMPEFRSLEPAGSGIEAVFRPDPSIWDGRFANLGWLQELPKPLTKVTWDNAAVLSPALAGRLGLSQGQTATIEASGRAMTLPVCVLPGQAEHTITLHFGHGRRAAGRVGTGTGFDVSPLRGVDDPWHNRVAALRPAGGTYPVADTQMHHAMEGLDLVRWASAGDDARPSERDAERHPYPSLYGEEAGAEDQEAWAMSIDLDLCIGCNACVTACVGENNIPVVGKEQTRMGREMHWIRVDRYFEGEPDDPAIHFQPVPCMHCEHAPCEVGCPVNATSHGPEGLNQMVYNRCIGTRTCSSYCPYKVRRFNFFDYAVSPESPARDALNNPDVSVRSRGVMEKCTYCVQRISKARRDAKAEDRPIGEGEVRTACQAACPTQAIVFGDQRNANSAVAAAKREPRDYVLLEDLNVRPRTSYRARLRPPGHGDGGG